jgi:ABC-type sugar transport system ATPase subunit
VGEEVLRVEGLSRRRYFEDISFTLHAGEVLGIAGLVGAGRTEVIRAVVGLDRFDSGSIYLHGRPQAIHSPGHAVSLGIALVPEDRKAEGIISVLSVRSNATLSVLRSMSTFGFLHFAKLKSKIDKLARILAIKAPRLGAPVSGLSGGNQQKVVLAKCLATDCRILILDEPTRGVDIGTKFDIYRQIDELVRSGMAVILISSELPEVLTLSDRILVMSEGSVAAELDGRTATQEEIMHNAVPRAEAGMVARTIQ